MPLPEHKIPADHFVDFLARNLDNRGISDEQFRQMVRDTLPGVEYKKMRFQDNPDE